MQRLTLPTLLLLLASASLADPVFTNRAGAIRGYDPVAYFTIGEPVKGSADFAHEWNGATWRFSSAENREKFLQDPEAYAPQYGGHCAYAMRTGKLVSTDPDAWDIVDGRLYLNYSKGIQKRWLKDISGFVSQADAQWAEKHAMAMVADES